MTSNVTDLKSLDQKETKELKDYLQTSLMQHRSAYKKVERIRQDIISQLGEIIPLEISNHLKKPLWDNQLGIGIDDEGIEFQIKLNRRSSFAYFLLRRNWDGIYRVDRSNDKLGIIDPLMKILDEILADF